MTNPHFPTPNPQPLIVITGPTASGKSSLAMELAEKYDGEIICADSRTIYTGMDIGTGKPGLDDRAQVPHHLLDVVRPDEQFSVADFQRLAYAAIDNIRARKKVPFLVGGTGLYINSVVLNYTFSSNVNSSAANEYRKSLDSKNVEELQQLIKMQHLQMPFNLKNKRHLVGTLLRGVSSSSAKSTPDDYTYVVGITSDSADRNSNIHARVEQMFRVGVVNEAKRLGDIYGWDSEAMTGNIYPIVRRVIDGEITQADAVQLIEAADMRLVKKQLTWMRRQDFVRWYDTEHARQFIEQLLSTRDIS